jgi:hypothetical protein
LPSLNALAERERRHVVVRIVVPDYSKPGSAAWYANIRRGLSEAADEHTLAANVVATVATAIGAAARNPCLHVQIGLCASVPVIRYDISSIGALITRDAPSLPAILVNAGNPYFETFRDAVENELGQAKKVTWDETAPVLRGGEQIPLKEMLSAITGLPPIDPAVIQRAEELIRKPEHRYA